MQGGEGPGSDLLPLSCSPPVIAPPAAAPGRGAAKRFFSLRQYAEPWPVGDLAPDITRVLTRLGRRCVDGAILSKLSKHVSRAVQRCLCTPDFRPHVMRTVLRLNSFFGSNSHKPRQVLAFSRYGISRYGSAHTSALGDGPVSASRFRDSGSSRLPGSPLSDNATLLHYGPFGLILLAQYALDLPSLRLTRHVLCTR